jgi:hypothetical protein
MSDMTHAQRMIEAYLVGLLEPEQEQKLARMIDESEEVRALMAAHIRLEGRLAYLGEIGQLGPVEEPAQPARVSFPRLIPLAAAAGLLIAVGIFFTRPEPQAPEPPAPAPSLARVTAAQGTVRCVIPGTEEMRDLALGDRLLPRMQITSSEGGSFSFTYEDEATTVELKERTSVSLESLGTSSQGKVLHVGYGRVSAVVAPQPKTRPMRLTTPNASMDVLGTAFHVTYTRSTTRLDVKEGSVLLTSPHDGSSMEVGAGSTGLVPGTCGVMPLGPPLVIDKRIDIPRRTGRRHGIAFDGTSLWVASQEVPVLYRIDSGTGDISQEFDFDGQLSHFWALSWDGSALWAVCVLAGHHPNDRICARLSPEEGRADTILDLGGINPRAVAFGDGYLWIGANDKVLWRIDPENGYSRKRICQLPKPIGWSYFISYADGAIWMDFYPSPGMCKVPVAEGSGHRPVAFAKPIIKYNLPSGVGSEGDDYVWRLGTVEAVRMRIPKNDE